MSNFCHFSDVFAKPLSVTRRRIENFSVPARCLMWLCLPMLGGELAAQAQVVAGPVFSEFRLTLDQGRRTEIAGPVFYQERREETVQWAFPPLMSMTHDAGIDSTE